MAMLAHCVSPVSNMFGAFETLGRAARVYTSAGQVYASYQVTRRKAKGLKKSLGITDDPKADDHPELLTLWEEAHTANAEYVYKSIISLRGFWIKVGQYLSSRADIVPIPYIKKLSALQDAVPHHPWEDVQKTLQEELGPEWRGRFLHVDEEPLSAASIAQVHRGTLKSGEEVVIKVQHRGVAPRMRSDLDNLSTLCLLVAWLEPDYDFRKIIDEWKPAVKQELDMRQEADALEEVHANLSASGVRAIVPLPRPEFTTEKVLVMDFCHGFSVRDTAEMDRLGVDREVLLGRICHAFAVQMHVNGFFNADPHPGNLLVSTSKDQNGGDASVPVLLDFGLTKRFTPHMLLAFARMMHATYAMDVDELVVAFKDMDLKLAVNDPLEDLSNMRKVFMAVPREKAMAMREEMKSERQKKMAAHPNPKKPVESWPAELVFFFRVTGLLRGLASSLDVEYPYLKTMAMAALETINNTTPEEERAKALLYQPEDYGRLADSPVRPSTTLQSKLEEAVARVHLLFPLVGLQVAVHKNGELIANIAAGTLGVADPRPVTPDSLFNVFSVTKGVISAAAMLLMQQGALDLNARVAEYWPEFASEGKGECTVRQLLNHQAGLANAMPELATLADLSDFDRMVSFVASAKPEHPPGAETHYHYLTFGWLVGGLIQKASGKPLTEVVGQLLLEPLGLTDSLFIGIPSDTPSSRLAILHNGFAEEISAMSKGRMGSLLAGDDSQQAGAIMHSASSTELAKEPQHAEETGQRQEPNAVAQAEALWARFKGREHLMNPTTFNMRQVREAVIPAANGHTSAFALSRLYSGLAAKLDGGLLVPPTVEACIRSATEERASPGQAEANPMLAQHQAAFGLGFQVHELSDAATGAAVHSLGHPGVGGSFALAIPEIQVAMAITVSNLTGSRIAPNLLCAIICTELGLVPPPSMVGTQPTTMLGMGTTATTG